MCGAGNEMRMGAYMSVYVYGCMDICADVKCDVHMRVMVVICVRGGHQCV
jgi:hypothetical protein